MTDGRDGREGRQGREGRDGRDFAVEEFREGLARVERAIDRVDNKVDSGDRQSQQLVELLKQQLAYLQQSVDDIKGLIPVERAHTDKAISAVRVDLERQLENQKVQGIKDLTEVVRRLDAGREDRRVMYERVDVLDRFQSGQAATNKVIAAIGTVLMSGVGALVFKAVGG